MVQTIERFRHRVPVLRFSTWLKATTTGTGTCFNSENFAERYENFIKQNDVIKLAWRYIDNPVYLYQAQDTPTNDCSDDWVTVRLFVSSTFRDFHCEREILVKRVIAELREWCAERMIRIIECDLRWGVPKDSTSKVTICACMEELDRCLQEQNGQPFFLGMLGERYGWVPGGHDVPEDIASRYNWIPTVSITHMEFIHGAFRCNNPNACFCLRDPACLESFEEDMSSLQQAGFLELDERNRKHLLTLKQKLQERFPKQVFPYKCTATKNKRNRITISGLEEFANDVLNFFKGRIEVTYPDRAGLKNVSDSRVTEARVQKIFAEQQAHLIYGRDDTFAYVISFVKGDSKLICTNPSLTTEDRKRMYSIWAHDEPSLVMPSLLIYGPTGFGKTCLMAHLLKMAVKSFPDAAVFYHFIGCSRSSRSTAEMLGRLLVFLSPDLEKRDLSSLDCSQLATMLKESLLIEEAGQQKILFIDGLNDLSDSESPQHLEWLPPFWPTHFRCILTATDSHLPTMARLRNRPTFDITLGEVDITARKLIVSDFFSRYNKMLDPTQLSLLVEHGGAACPLWLLTVCEELRIFGEFAKVTKRIQSFPDSLVELMCQMLNRMTEEDDSKLLEALCQYIACSRDGLIEQSIIPLLSRHLPRPSSSESGSTVESLDSVPSTTGSDRSSVTASVSALQVAIIRRTLKPFLLAHLALLPSLKFFHQSVYEAVDKSFLVDRKSKIDCHARLADFFENSLVLETNFISASHIGIEICFHLEQSHQPERLVNFLKFNSKARYIPESRSRMLLLSQLCKFVVSSGDTANKNAASLCLSCQTRSGGFSNSSQSNKDICCICGKWAPLNASPTSPATIKYCSVHQPLAAPPNHTRCYLCKCMTSSTNTCPVRVCQWCRGARLPNCCWSFSFVRR